MAENTEYPTADHIEAGVEQADTLEEKPESEPEDDENEETVPGPDMGTMYDAVDVAAIPADAEIVAGYVDGNWPTYTALVAAFPHAQHVSITTGASGGAGARVADCETGDLTPAAAAHWAAGEIAAGRRPCIYYAKSTAGEVSTALKAAGVALSAVDYWVADWTGIAHVVPGSVATQWASPATGSGGNFDISETVGTWPAAAPAPPPPAPPAPPPTPSNVKEGNDDVITVTESAVDGNRHVFVYDETAKTVTHWYQHIEGPNFEWTREELPGTA